MSFDNKIKDLYYNISEVININLILVLCTDKSISRLSKYELPNFVKDIELDLCNKFIQEFSNRDANDILFYETDINLKYLCFSICNNGDFRGCLILGPYMTYKMPIMDIQDMARKNNISTSVMSSLNEFLKKIPIFNESKENILSNSVFAMLNSNTFNLNKINLNNNNLTYSTKNINYTSSDSKADIESIRNRYKIESELLYYVSQGFKEKALDMLMKDSLSTPNRFPDYPVRNMKNLSLTMNTLFRKSVENNNIDTYLIHLTSDEYAIKIEKSKNIKELKSILISMTSSYCDLVNEYNNKNYSNLVSKAINFIKINFKDDINLKSISDSIFIHPNYLATKFKTETGCTITEYINKVRIRESEILLKNTPMSIADIAYDIGFNDSKYFAKIFKKYNNVSPSKYRNV